jgi:GT2 family glycosyltransferase
VVGKHLIDWVNLRTTLTERRAGLVSVIIPKFAECRLTSTAIRSVIDHGHGTDLEVIVIDNGSRRHVAAILEGLFGADDRVRIVRVPRNLNFALANNYALSLSSGEYVVALNNDTETLPGWLTPLTERLEADESVLGVQPLLLYPDGSVQTAGTVFIEGEPLPRHFLSGLPVDVALRVKDTAFSAVTAAALCMRAADLIDLHGFDPIYTNGLEDVDLCLRARERRPGGTFRVANESRVVHREGKTPGRSLSTPTNREIFVNRWVGRLPATDGWRYEALDVGPISGTSSPDLGSSSPAT